MVAGGVSGAWIGAVAATWTDTGIPDDTLKSIGAMIKNGMSAVVVLTEAKWAENVQELLLDNGGSLIPIEDDENNQAETAEAET